MANVIYINPSWIESAKKDLDDQDMREYYYWLVECRMFNRNLDECDNKLIKIALRDVLRQADDVQVQYETQVQEAKKGGRKQNPNTEAIYKMAKEGKTGSEIAIALNMNNKTIYSNAGWKKAQAELKGNNSSENSEFTF